MIGPFAFAGLWEHWEGADSAAIESCTIITTDANDLLRPLHDRMPVILPEQEYGRWLDPQLDDPVKLQALLKPYPVEEMTAYPPVLFAWSRLVQFVIDDPAPRGHGQLMHLCQEIGH